MRPSAKAPFHFSHAVLVATALGTALCLCTVGFGGCKPSRAAPKDASSSAAPSAEHRCEEPLEALRAELAQWASHDDEGARQAARQGLQALARSYSTKTAVVPPPTDASGPPDEKCTPDRAIAEAALAQARALADLAGGAEHPDAARPGKAAQAQQARFEASRQRALAAHAALPFPSKPPRPQGQSDTEQDDAHEAQDTELRPAH